MNNDLISREDLKNLLLDSRPDDLQQSDINFLTGDIKISLSFVLKIIDNAPVVKEVAVAEKTLDSQWIPITFRQADDDEYKEFIERYDDIPREECKVYNCRMPDDGQEVLVTTSWGSVCEDIFHADFDDYGFEDHEDPDDVIAWMPKPKAYEKGGDGE